MNIAGNIKRVEDRIAAACARARRDPAEVSLVGISKQKSADDIICAIEAGLQHIGENRVEEGIKKIPRVLEGASNSVTWHMVGHVQSRKAKHVAKIFDVVQSIDSVRLAQRLSRLAVDENRELDVLLEINVSGEASKYGFKGYNWYRDAAVLEGLLDAHGEIMQLQNLKVRGLMTMAPLGAGDSTNRRVFADLFALREEMQSAANMPLPELSMGMTDDFELAIEEGATMVRVGRAIFGDRT
ncbi:MAG: YggS family pyridoxal phosphate-dependent enzyme [Chloroflexi bacterium]|nr:YggS family pyridoxal phosphate-dependent enzyme [Chloroflexota bacterium]